MSSVILFTAAALFGFVGWWGRRNVSALVRHFDDPGQRAHKRSVLVRGSYACYATAALISVGGLLEAI